MVSVILTLSILIQFFTAFIAFRHMRVAGRIYSWLLVALALLLMGARRTITLAQSIAVDEATADIGTELISLLISLLMLFGVWALGRFLQRLNQLRLAAERSLDEYRRLETMAGESEENLRVTLESIGDAVIATDCESRVVRMNKVARQLTGWSLDEAQGRPLTEVFDIVNAYTREKVENPVDRVLSEGRIVGLANHTVLLAKDGKKYQIADSAAPIYNDAGEIIGVVLVFRDVTETYHLQEKLRCSERDYRLLFEHMTHAFALHEIVVDDDTGKPVDYVFLNVNPAFEEFTGLKKDDIVGRRVTEVLPGTENDPADWIGLYGQVALTGREMRFEQYSETLKKWFNVLAYRPQPGQFAVVFNDITKHKQAERQLEENAARLQSIFDGAEAVPIQGYDESRRVVFWNRASELLYGYARDEALGEKLEDLIVPDNLRELVIDSHRRWLEDAAPIPAGEVEMMTKAGTSVLVYSSHVMIENVDGHKEMFCIDVDLTERRRLEEERQRMQKLESLGTVAGGIAHDFNNLLTGVFGNIELASLELPPEHEAGRLLKIAHGALNSARRLTGRLLTFAKGGNPVFETLDIRSCIRDTIDFNLSGGNIAAQFDIPDDLWPVKADKGQLEQVLGNLAINAKQAMPAGGNLYVSARNVPDIDEHFARELHGDYVKITIRDEGIGIPANLIERVFDPYFTTKQAGSGLGLAVVYSIVNKHKGHISVESPPDSGTMFTIFLPVDKKGSGNIESAPSGSSVGSNAQVEHGKHRVLIMDDEEIVLRTTTRMLERNGYRVETVMNGQDALARYRAAMNDGQVFDVVIMDLTIPGGMGGKEAVRELLAIDPNARVLVASGYSSDTILANYQDFGFVGCLPKPFALDVLIEKISTVIKE